jgi:hypothetical protein
MGACQWKHGQGRLECVHCGKVVHTRSRSVRSNCPVNQATETVWAQAGLVNSGPGTELKKLLAGWPLYIAATENCPCNRHAAEMDAWGADGCAARQDQIVGWLRVEAERSGLPFADVAGRLLVRRAIRNARKKSPRVY